MLTIFASPRAFTGEFDVIQRNAVASWTRLRPRPQGLLIDDVMDAAAEVGMQRGPDRILIAIPAYNEEATLGEIIERLLRAVPHADLLVVNDGSRDRTEMIAQNMGVAVVTHLSNLGYGRAIQTALMFASRACYDVLVTLDGDGQHRPEDVPVLLERFLVSGCDMLIGSRLTPGARPYRTSVVRRMGMHLFSAVVRLLTGILLYDTSSGLRVIRHTVFGPLTRRLFGDFHAEAIVYLLGCGYSIAECAITVEDRRHRSSMHGFASLLKYPWKTCARRCGCWPLG